MRLSMNRSKPDLLTRPDLVTARTGVGLSPLVGVAGLRRRLGDASGRMGRLHDMSAIDAVHQHDLPDYATALSA
jgi:hypothetical protein